MKDGAMWAVLGLVLLVLVGLVAWLFASKTTTTTQSAEQKSAGETIGDAIGEIIDIVDNATKKGKS